MFLTDNYSIKEVLTFPFMKDLEQEKDKEKRAAEVAGVEPKPEEGIGKPFLSHGYAMINYLQPTSDYDI
jgi:hypothetical protein